MKRKIVYFIRHGQSEHNRAFEEKALTGAQALDAYATGFHDSRLSALGMQEAHALRATLQSIQPPPQAVLVSPLSRTLQTAALAFAGSEAPLRAREEWRERHGRWPCERRRGVRELRAEFPAVDFGGIAAEDELWQDAREGQAAASARAEHAVSHLLACDEEVLAVVSHSGFMGGTVFGGKAPSLRVAGWPQRGFANCELRAVELLRHDDGHVAAKLLWRRAHQAERDAAAEANAEASMRALYKIMAGPEGEAQLQRSRPQMRALWLPLKPLPLTGGAVTLSGVLSVETRHRSTGVEHLPWRIPFKDRELFAVGGPTNALPAVARMSAGVRLTFTGSVRRLRLVAISSDAHRGASYDLVVNNSIVATKLVPSLLAASEGELSRPYVDDTGPVSQPAEPNMPHEVLFDGLSTAAGDVVELWLPHASAISLLALEVDMGAAIQQHMDARPRWIVHGSSLTHCIGADSPARTWPAVAARIADVQLTCLGFAGQCHMEQVVARSIRDHPADAIALEFGIDVQSMLSLSSRLFASQALGFIQTIRDGHPNTPIVVIAPTFGTWREEQSSIVEDGAREGSQLSMTCPSFREMRQELQAVVRLLQDRGDAALSYRDGCDLLSEADARHMLLPDGLHPNAKGCELMGQRFASLEFGPAGRLLPGRAAISARL